MDAPHLRHRVAPAPISSGLSFRTLPEATLAQIIAACQHHEARLAGTAAAASVGGRCTYDLSRDVQDLVRVLKLREDAQADKIRKLEALLGEYTRTFEAPSRELQEAGVSPRAGNTSPAALATFIVQQHASLSALQQATRSGSTLASKEVHDLRLALRDVTRTAREQSATEISRIKADADAAIAAERAARHGAEAMLRSLQDNFERDVAVQVQAEVNAVVSQHNEAVAALNARLEATQRQAVAESRRLSGDADHAFARVQALQEELTRANEHAELRVREMQQRAVRAEAALTEATAAHAAATAQQEAASKAAVEQLRDQFSRSVAATRVAGMEAQIAFLTARCSDLEALTDAMQRALAANRPAASRAALPRPAPDGLRTAHVEHAAVAHAAASTKPRLPTAAQYVWAAQ